ncbi:MAG: hypothetical protein EZS28_048012, partial [Streblomastix strix]
LIHESQGC